MIHVGVTSVIAHIKVGQMHAALESKVLVVSAQGQSVNTWSVVNTKTDLESQEIFLTVSVITLCGVADQQMTEPGFEMLLPS